MKITFVGLGGCPFSNRAADVRQNAFAELFVSMGYEVEIINRFSRKKANRGFPRFKVVEPFRNIKAKGSFAYVFFYILALLCEPFRLIRSNCSRHIDVVYVYSAHCFDHIFYKLICCVIRAKLVSQYCEYNSCMMRNNLYFRINKRYIDSKVPKLWDGALCISHFLEEACHKISAKTKTLLVYPICNFSTFNKSPFEDKVDIERDYILFCSSESYQSVVEFIIKAYNISQVANRLQLVMVISGNRNKIETLRRKYPEVSFLCNLEYDRLLAYYRNAKALLIPLRDNIRDKARFPHKICEYAASKGVVVTTNLGEMPYIFKDGDNALVAQGYDVETFAQKLAQLTTNMDFTPLKERCYKTGLQHFDIHAYKDRVRDFLNEVVKS